MQLVPFVSHFFIGSPAGDDVVYLRRLHSVHPSNSDFKRLIAFVSGKCYAYLGAGGNAWTISC